VERNRYFLRIEEEIIAAAGESPLSQLGQIIEIHVVQEDFSLSRGRLLEEG
jgi:hypothetical protein